MEIIKINQKNTSEYILNDLKGRKFFAVSITNNDKGTRDYEYHISQNMSSEEVIYGCNMVIRRVIEEDDENEI